MRKILIFGLLIWSVIISCERDDLCLDAHTPGLVVVFKNQITQQKEPVDSLVVLNMAGDTIVPFSVTDSITLPLALESQETRFKFIYRNGNTVVNPDEVVFQYQPEPYFAGKACGYIMHFKNLTASSVNDGDNWIQQIQVVIPVITQDSTAHVEIYH